MMAIVLDEFSVCYSMERAVISSEEIRKFREAWFRLDRESKGYIRLNDLAPLLIDMGHPLGLNMDIREGRDVGWFVQTLFMMKQSIAEPDLPFNGVLKILSLRFVETHYNTREEMRSRRNVPTNLLLLCTEVERTGAKQQVVRRKIKPQKAIEDGRVEQERLKAGASAKKAGNRQLTASSGV
jgi:hypothetical protein